MFPTCLRVKPPKMTIGDEQVNTIFQDKMRELCETYKKGLQDTYLQSLDSSTKALETKVNQYPMIFDNNLNQAFSLLADCKMVDSRPFPRTPYSTSMTDVWKHTREEWKREIRRDFLHSINNFLSQMIKTQAISTRNKK